MEAQEVIGIIKQTLPTADIKLEGQDCNFTVYVISDQFQDMLPLERQQLILNGFTSHLREGTIHALTVKAYTTAQWEASQALTTILVKVLV